MALMETINVDFDATNLTTNHIFCHHQILEKNGLRVE
jgi:hypothetical protein